MIRKALLNLPLVSLKKITQSQLSSYYYHYSINLQYQVTVVKNFFPLNLFLVVLGSLSTSLNEECPFNLLELLDRCNLLKNSGYQWSASMAETEGHSSCRRRTQFSQTCFLIKWLIHTFSGSYIILFMRKHFRKNHATLYVVCSWQYTKKNNFLKYLLLQMLHLCLLNETFRIGHMLKC